MNKEKLFKEKISILNSEFVEFINEAIKSNPSYDLCPPLRDYIIHVQELDKMYAERPVLVAVRKNKPRNNDKVNTESAKKEEPKKLDNGLVEPAGQFSFAPKIQMPELKNPSKETSTSTFLMPKSTPTFSVPKPPGTTTPLSAGRKRKPGDSLDYNKMLSTSSEDYGKSEKRNSDIFGSKSPETSKDKSDEQKTKTPSTGSFLGIGSKDNSSSSNQPAAKLPSLFGASKPSETLNTDNSTSSSSSLFSGLKKPGEATVFGQTPPSGSLFGGLINKSKAETSQSTANASGGSLFGNLTKSPDNSANGTNTSSQSLSLPSLFGSKSNDNSKDNNGTTTATTTSTTSTIFGGLLNKDNSSNATTTAPMGSLFGGLKPTTTFTFKPVVPVSYSTSENNGEKKDEGEEGEGENQPPPKFEAVKHDEPDAVFSTKCSLHNFVDGEYKKAGTGFVYIKKIDNGTQLLIRAATTVGNVLVNTLINDSFKAESKPQNRIQFSYPTESGIKTHLAKVIDFQTTLDYFTKVKEP